MKKQSFKEYLTEMKEIASSKYPSNSDKTLNESSLNRIYQQYMKYDTGTISGFRFARECGTRKQYTLAENKKRNAIVRAKLLSNGFGVTEIKGAYIENFGSKDPENPQREVAEDSFFVVDIKNTGKLKSVLMGIAKEFEQDSITYAKAGGAYYLISTNECSKGYPGFGEIGVEEKLGTPKFGSETYKTKDGEVKVEDFFSRVKNRAFVFKESVSENMETLDKLSLNEVRSVKMMVNKTID